MCANANAIANRNHTTYPGSIEYRGTCFRLSYCRHNTNYYTSFNLAPFKEIKDLGLSRVRSTGSCLHCYRVFLIEKAVLISHWFFRKSTKTSKRRKTLSGRKERLN